MRAVFRPMFGRILAAVVGVVCAVAAIGTTVGGGVGDAAPVLPWLALVAGACWAIFWRPCVEVTDGGVRIVNVTRTIDVPWPAIEGIETRWALTLVTAYGRFTAWAAPTGGRAPARRAARSDVRILGRTLGSRESADASLGSSDAATDAASIVQDHWERLRAAGHLDNPVLEHARAPVRWHAEIVAVGLVLVVLGVIGAIV